MIGKRFLWKLDTNTGMIEKIHEHIIDELRTNTKTDIIFILTAILLNFIGLGINAIFASKWASEGGMENIITFSIVVGLILIVNTIVIFGLSKGKQTRNKLLTGLLMMYKDQNVEKYYDKDILSAYNTRYSLFTLAVIATGIVGISIPFVTLLMG